MRIVTFPAAIERPESLSGSPLLYVFRSLPSLKVRLREHDRVGDDLRVLLRAGACQHHRGERVVIKIGVIGGFFSLRVARNEAPALFDLRGKKSRRARNGGDALR